MSLEQIINRCLETGINCIAIADHDSVEGALEMQSLAPFLVIVAGEIMTNQGEIMGMFLKEGVPMDLPIEQAISRVKAQDALVCLPHPFDTFRGLKVDNRRLEELVEQIDIIELFNARGLLLRDSTKARVFADKYGLPGTAGSDAHTASEIGNTYVEMPAFDGRDDFLQALRKGRISSQRSSPLVHFGSTWARLRKWF